MDPLNIINKLFSFYYLLIILRIFLSWFPNLDWYKQPTKFIREITDAYLDIFRRIIPPMGGLDFSPIIALIALNIIQVIVQLLVVNISSVLMG